MSLAYITSGFGGLLKFDSFFKNASTFSFRIPRFISEAHVSDFSGFPDELSPQPKNR